MDADEGQDPEENQHHSDVEDEVLHRLHENLRRASQPGITPVELAVFEETTMQQQGPAQVGPDPP